MIDVNTSVVEAISSQLPGVTDEQVASVLEALNVVKSGAPLGTIVSDLANGTVAVRVSDNGVHQWRVTSPDGGSWIDLQPNLEGWAVIKEGQATE